MEKKGCDFVSGIVLIILGIAVTLESVRIWHDVGGDFIESPGLMPATLAVFLIIASLTMTVRSFVRGGKSAMFGELKESISTVFVEHRKFARDLLVVIGFLAFFTFILLPSLPFWLSSFLFMIGMMKIAGAKKNWIIALASVVTSASLHIIFEVLFRVPLPTAHWFNSMLTNF